MTKKDQEIVARFREKYPETFSVHGLELTVVKKFMKENSSAWMIAVHTEKCKKGICTGFILIWNHCSSLNNLGEYDFCFYRQYDLVNEQWVQ